MSVTNLTRIFRFVAVRGRKLDSQKWFRLSIKSALISTGLLILLANARLVRRAAARADHAVLRSSHVLIAAVHASAIHWAKALFLTASRICCPSIGTTRKCS
jgi:hypothetical protein